MIFNQDELLGRGSHEVGDLWSSPLHRGGRSGSPGWALRLCDSVAGLTISERGEQGFGSEGIRNTPSWA